MAENDFEKTEAPTPRRLQEARREGNVAKSMDLTAACVLLCGVVMLNFFGERVAGGLKVLMAATLGPGQADNPTRPDDLVALTAFSVDMVATALIPMLAAIMLIALVSTLGQVGFLLTAKPLVPNPSKLSPLKGAKNLVNARAGIRLAMSLAKITVVAAVATWFITKDLPWILHIAELQTRPAIVASCQLIYALALKLALLLLLLAILDYVFQRWQHTREMRMSKQDIKEEMKRMDGDPLTKQRRARVARQLAMQRIATAVPKADVIVTNPTHFAVALRYDNQTMAAPKVIAKGADFMAMRIRQIAASHNIPIVERKPLARALYKSVDVGGEVPPEHYAAVAEILAYVYRLDGEQAAVA